MNWVHVGKRWINLENVTEVIDTEVTVTTAEGKAKIPTLVIRFVDSNRGADMPPAITQLQGADREHFLGRFEREIAQPVYIIDAGRE